MPVLDRYLSAWTLKEKIQLAGIACFVATLPFYRELNQILYGVFILSCLPLCKYDLWRKRRLTIVAFAGIYLIAVFSSFYAPDSKAAFSTLQLQLALLLSPVMMGISYVPSKAKNEVIKISFIAGISAALIYLFIVFLNKMHIEQLSLSTWLEQENLNHQYSSPIEMHATILSTYVAICTSLIIELLVSVKGFLIRALFFLLFILCIVSLFLLSSRIVLATYGVCLLFLILFNPRLSLWPGKLLITSFVLVILTIFFVRSNYFKTRFNQDIQKDLKWSQWRNIGFYPNEREKNAVLKNDGSRIERWIAAIELIKEKPLLGFGTGQEKPQLFQKYKEMGLTVTLEQGYDAHNQFLSIMIKSGIIGLVSLVILFVRSFYIGVKNKDQLFICFVLLIVAVCMVENYLNVNKGLFFFAFFNIFLALNGQVRIDKSNGSKMGN